MKNFIATITMLCMVLTSYAQPWSNLDVQQGEIARDWIEYDELQNNLPFHLYNILDSGKTVYIFVFPYSGANAWMYFNSNVLQNFYTAYGPSGSNIIRMFSASSGGSYDSYFGFSSTTQGDWSLNMTFPHIFPTGYLKAGGHCTRIYRICPDRRMYCTTKQLDQLPLSEFPTVEELEAGIGMCEFSSVATDAKIVFSNADTLANCGSEQRAANAYLCNMGTEPLTSCEIVATVNGEVVQSVNWTGNLAAYQLDTISFNDILTPLGQVDMRFYVQNPNGIADQNLGNDTLYRPLAAPVYWDSDTIFMELSVGGLGQGFYWDIQNSAGEMIDFGGDIETANANGYDFCVGPVTSCGSSAYVGGENITKAIALPLEDDCYTIRLLQGWGVGLLPSYNLGGDTVEIGYMRFKKGNEVIFEFGQFGRRAYAKFETSSPLTPIQASYAVVNTTNTQSNGSITVTATGGVAPYQYSKDCGANFSSSNEFSNLLAGTYCMVTKDAVGQMVIDTVEVQNVNDPLFASYAVTHTTNGLANGSITVTATGGVAPYQYSKDCGLNFGSSNEFGGLAAGSYCMVTKDAIGQIVTDTMEVQNVNDPLFASYAVTHTTNGLANGSITVTATGGVAPYQYSNDCGGNFGSSNEFGGLAAGSYCMVTKDAIGQTVTDTIEVNSSLSGTDVPRGLSGLSVRPNPAKDIVNIGFVLSQSSNIGIEVFNEIGQQVVSIPLRVYVVGQHAIPIDVAALPSGLYFVVLQDERGASTTRFEKR